jgi:hypothetical protein
VTVTWLLLLALHAGDRPVVATADSARVGYYPAFIAPYRDDPGFRYTRATPAGGPSFWERLLRELAGREIDPRWVKRLLYLLYALAAGGVAWVVYLALRRGGLPRAWWRREARVPGEALPAGVTGDAIHARLLAGMEAAGDYHMAARMHFSVLLHDMDRAGVIRWNAAKSNREYLHEIRDPRLRERFAASCLVFEHVCYGDFPLDRERYARVDGLFRSIREEVAG